MRYIVAVIAFVLMAGQAQSAGLAKSGFIQRVITRKNTGASSTETFKLYWEGDNMRVERYTVAGLLVRIKKGTILYIYSPEDKQAVKMTVPAGQGETVQQLLGEMAGPVKNGKKVGTARIAGVVCNVYTSSGHGSSARAYVSTDPRLPTLLKSQQISGPASQTIETVQIKLNQNVPDSIFALPRGVKVQEQKFPTPPAAPKK